MTNSPFKLLESYGAGDKDIFFGRDSEVYALYNLLQQTQLALVYGASGTGKTSLINAGLPKVFKLADWFKISVRRKDNINESLVAAIGSQLPDKPTIAELPGAVRQIFEARWIPVYLVFDQFEELFTLSQDEEEKKLFFKTLQAILRENTAVKVILSMREEYIGHLYDYEYLLPALFENRFRVEAMKDDTVCQVISRTCRVRFVQLEKGDDTARAIMRQLKFGRQAVHLPHLQIYLHSLYEKAMELHGKPRFTEVLLADKEYTLSKVLNRFIGGKIADAQAFLKEKHPSIPATLAESLLDDFATNDGTKKALRATELAKKHQQPLGVILDALLFFDEKAKLLRADEDEVERYEPVHDVVALQIHERRSVEDKEFKKFIRDLEMDYERWLADKSLLSEAMLNKVEVYRERLEGKEEWGDWKELVEASKKHLENLRKRKRVRNIVLAVITVAAVAAMVWALIAQNKTQAAFEQVEMEKAGKEKERQKAESNFLFAKKAEEKALAAQDSIGKLYKNYLTEQRKKFLTEAKAARNEKRFSEALKAYRNALDLADSPTEQSSIRMDITNIEKEKNDFEFQRNKDIGLAMKSAGDCKGALFYLELANKGRGDKAVKDAIEACKQN